MVTLLEVGNEWVGGDVVRRWVEEVGSEWMGGDVVRSEEVSGDGVRVSGDVGIRWGVNGWVAMLGDGE